MTDYIVNGVNLRNLLQGLMHHENTGRRRCEAEWEQLVPVPGVAHAIFSLAMEPTTQVGEASLCFILLKNNLKHFSPADVEFVQNNILDALAACHTPAVSRLMASVAVGVAILNDGKWGLLYSALEGMLSEDSVDGHDRICNGLVAISELCAVLPADILVMYVNLSTSLIPIALNPASAKSNAAFNGMDGPAHSPSPSGTPPLAPLDAPVSMLFASGGANISRYERTHAYSGTCQKMALRAIADMALVVGLKEGHTLALVCTKAYDALVAIGCMTVENDAIMNAIAHEALKIASVVGDFQPPLATPESFVKVATALSAGADVFRYLAVDENTIDEEVIESVKRCSSTRWDFISSFFRSKIRSAAILEDPNNSAQYLAHIPGVALQYCILTTSQQAEWALDANSFLKGEEDREDEVSGVVRDVAAEACQQLLKRAGAAAWTTIFDLCQSVLLDQTASWPAKEAALYLLSACIGTRINVIKQAPAENHSALFELAGSIVSNDLASNVNGHLVARALLFFRSVVRTCGGIMPTQRIALQLLSPAVQTLQSRDPIIACSAVLLLTKMVARCPRADVTAHSTTALQSILNLAQGSDHELLYMLLELVLAWLKASDIRHVSCAAEVPLAVLSIWQRQLEDPNIAELVVDLFSYMLKRAPQSHDGFAPLLPWMSSALGGTESLTAMCAIPSVLVVVRDMIKHGSDGVIANVGNVLLGALCRLLLNTEDSGVTNAASSTLAFLIRRLGSAVFHCTVQMPASHLNTTAAADGALPPLDEEDIAVPVANAMQAIAAKMLSPQTREYTLLNAGSFLKELVPVVAASQGLPQFLLTLVDRALTLQMDSTFQELALPISLMLEQQCEAALATLDDNGRLVPYFEAWLPKQKVFDGKLVLRHTTLAMAAVLNCIGGDTNGPGGRPIKWGKGKGRAVIQLRLAVFVALGKQLNVALKSKSSEYKSDTDDDLETLSDADSMGGDISDDDYDDDIGLGGGDNESPMGSNEMDGGQSDEEQVENEKRGGGGRTKVGPSGSYHTALQQLGSFVSILGADAASGEYFTAKEIASLQKLLGSSSR